MANSKSTKIRIIDCETGKLLKSIPNVSINYSLDLVSIKKMVALSMRLSPQDPLYHIEDIKLQQKDGEAPFDESVLLTIQKKNRSKYFFGSSSTNEISLNVKVTPPDDPPTTRTSFNSRSRSFSLKPNHDIENQNNHQTPTGLSESIETKKPFSVPRNSTPQRNSRTRLHDSGEFVRPSLSTNTKLASPRNQPQKEFQFHTPIKETSAVEGIQMSPTSPPSLSPVFDRPGLCFEGRPSVHTMEVQWEFMRSHFVQRNDGELEWLMVSKRDGACLHARNKLSEAEDRYFRALFRISKLETRQKRLANPTRGRVPEVLGQMAALHIFVGGSDDSGLTDSLNKLVARLRSVLSEELGEGDLQPTYSPGLWTHLSSLLDGSLEKVKAIRLARSLQGEVGKEAAGSRAALSQARRDSEEALAAMEKWSKREKETEEYPRLVMEEERVWMERERERNQEALCSLRSLVPPNISLLSLSELMTLARDRGGLIPAELALELKTNRLLHWVVTHPSDIETSNFLTGEFKASFENLEGLDLTEIRAIALCLPLRFDNDKEGRKAEWRERFMGRLRQLVSQEREESVKGGWDPITDSRAQVKLPKLKPEQVRKSLYFYRTREQCLLRLQTTQKRVALLERKRGWLRKAEEEARSTKDEFDTVLSEMRDPDLREMYGTDQFQRAKDLAKAEWSSAEKRRKELAMEVSQLETSLSRQPSTEEISNSIEELELFLTSKGHREWSQTDHPPIPVFPVFDSHPLLSPAQKQAQAKFVSSEEEAEERRRELHSLVVGLKGTGIGAGKDSESETDRRERDNNEILSIPPPPPSRLSSRRMFFEGNGGKGEETRGGRGRGQGQNFSRSEREGREGSVPGSVLHRVGPEMMNTLNNLYRPSPPPSLSPPSPLSLPPSSPSPSPSSSTSLSVHPAPSSSLTRETKSKYMMKLIQAPTSELEPRPSPSLSPSLSLPRPPTPLSFLSQIKSRAKSQEQHPSPPSSAPSPPLPAVSFLDQIRARAQKNEKENEKERERRSEDE